MRRFVGLLLALTSVLVAAAAAPGTEGSYIKVEVKGTVIANPRSHHLPKGGGYIIVDKDQYEFDLFPGQPTKDEKEWERRRKEVMRFEEKR
jgi:hypothetical protein